MNSKSKAKPLTFAFVVSRCFYAFALFGTLICTVDCATEFIRSMSDLQLQPANQAEMIISILLTIMFYVAALATHYILGEEL